MSESAGIGQAATQLLGELQQAQQDVRQREQHAAEEAGKAFFQAMEEAKKTRFQENAKFRRETVERFLPKLTLIGDTARYEKSRLAALFKHLVAGQDEMTQIMEESLSGKSFSGSDILKMQASVFRYCQELEYSTKVVEKADSGVKQVLNTNIG